MNNYEKFASILFFRKSILKKSSSLFDLRKCKSQEFLNLVLNKAKLICIKSVSHFKLDIQGQNTLLHIFFPHAEKKKIIC